MTQAYVPAMRATERPASVLILAIFSFIQAAVFVLGGLYGWIAYAAGIGYSNPVLASLRHDPVYLVSIFGVGAISVGLHVLLAASAAASLKLRPWAWRGMVTYAWAFLVVHLINSVVTAFYVLPVTLKGAMAQAFQGRPMPPGTEAIMYVSAVIGAILGVVLWAAVPVLILVFYHRPRVRKAFGR